MRVFVLSIFTVLILCLIATPVVQADTTWTGAGGDSNWTTANNWGGIAPTNTDAAVIPNNATPFAVTVVNGSVANTVTATNAALTHAAGTATFGTSLTLDTGATYALSGGTLSTPRINVNNGTFTFSSGTLNTGTSGTVAVNVASDGKFIRDLTVQTDQGTSYAFTGTGTVRYNLSNVDSKVSNKFPTGFTGTVELSNTNSRGSRTANAKLRSGDSYTGFLDNPNLTLDIIDSQLFLSNANTTVRSKIKVKGTGNSENRGAFRLGKGSISGTVTLTGDATFGLEGASISGAISSEAPTNETYTLTFGTSNSQTAGTFSGIISDGDQGGKLAVTVALGTPSFTKVNTYTGSTTISGGTLNLGIANAIATSTRVTNNAAITATSAQTLNNLSGTAGTASINIGANDLTLNNTANSSYGGTITGNASVLKTGTGTLTLSGANTFTGGMTISGGQIIATNASALGTGAVTNYSALEFNLTDSGEYDKVISGSGALYKTGDGTLTLSGANEFTGGMTISAGKVSVATESTSLGAGALTLNTGATLLLTGGDSFETLDIPGVATLNGTLDLTNYLTTAWNQSKDYTLMTTGSIGSTEGLSLSGISSGWGWEQSGTSILLKYSGGALGWNWTGTTGFFMTAANWENNAVPETASDVIITKEDGVAQINENAQVKTVTLGKASNLQFTAGNTLTAHSMSMGGTDALNLTGGNLTLTNAPAFNINNDDTANTSTLTLSTGTYANVLSGNTNLTKTGADTLTLSGANTYTGATTISDGTLALEANNAIASSASVTVINNAEITATSVQTFNNLSGTENTASINLGTNALTLNNTADSSYAGTITAASLTKTGTGMLTLSSANTFSGGATVSAGTLKLANATAAGSGTIYVGNADSDTETIRLIFGANASNKIVISADTPSTSMPVITSSNGLQTLTGTVAFNHSTTLYGLSDRLTFQGVWSGNGDIIIDGDTTIDANDGGPRVTHDSKANTWTGNMVIKSGAIFQPGHANTLNAVNDIEVNGTLQLNNVNQTIGAISGTGIIKNRVGGKTLTVNQATDSTFSGTLTNGSGTLTFIKTGVGTLTLSGTNTYTGTTTISGGRIIATNLSAFGTGTVTNNSELEFNLATDGTYSKVISGSGALYKSGDGTLTLSAANTFTGGMTISEGKVSVATGSTSLGNGALTLNNGATLMITGGDSNKTLAISGAATLNGILDLTNYLTTWETGSTYTLMTANSIDSTTGLTLSGVDTGWGWEQSGTSILLKYSGGTLDWNWTGTTGSFMTATNWENTKVPETTSDVTINNEGGVAQIDSDATVKTVTLGKASNLQFTAGNTLTAETMTMGGTDALNLTGGNLTLTNAPAFNINNDDTANASTLTLSTGTYANVLSGNTNLTKTGDGTLTLSGTNTYTGATTVSAGTLALSGTGVFNSDSVINIAENGTLKLASTAYSQSTPFANTITGAGTILQVASSAGMESDISGFTGTFKIQKDVYFTGNIDGSNSNWIVSDGATLKTVSGNTIQINSITTDSGTYLARNWMDATDPNATYKIGSGIISGTIGYTAGTNETQKQRMSMVALEKVSDGTTSGGTLTLSGENTYTGGTTISDGMLVITSSKALGTGAVTNNSQLEFNLTTTNSGTYGQVISGTGIVTKSGAGTLTLSGENTYTGATTVSAGKLNITNSGAISNSAKIIIESGAEIESTASQTIHNLNGSGTYTAGGELTINSTLNNNMFNGTIDAGTSNIIFTGNGRQKISFVPSSTDGTLTATSIMLQSGRLDIKGVVAADLKITNGTFSSGNSVGSLTANSLLLNGGTALFEFDKTLGSDGAWDTLTIVDSGNITLTSGVFSLYIDDYNFWHKVGEEYQLISGTTAYATDTDLTDWLASAYQKAWSLTGKTDGIYLIAKDAPVTSVPEPSTWALLILGALGLMYFRRKK